MRTSASSGVTSKALATALMASRRVKVDPSRVTGIALVLGSQVLVDLPVIERHAFLSGQDPEDGLGVCRVRAEWPVRGQGRR